jgi:hypothetical protein
VVTLDEDDALTVVTRRDVDMLVVVESCAVVESCVVVETDV